MPLGGLPWTPPIAIGHWAGFSEMILVARVVLVLVARAVRVVLLVVVMRAVRVVLTVLEILVESA